MADVFTELQDSYFFYPNTSVANNQEVTPYQPVLWCIFTSIIDKNNEKISYQGRKVNFKTRSSFRLWEDMLIAHLFVH